MRSFLIPWPPSLCLIFPHFPLHVAPLVTSLHPKLAPFLVLFPFLGYHSPLPLSTLEITHLLGPAHMSPSEKPFSPDTKVVSLSRDCVPSRMSGEWLAALEWKFYLGAGCSCGLACLSTRPGFVPWCIHIRHFACLASGAQCAIHEYIRELPVRARSSAPLIHLCNWITSNLNVCLEASYGSNLKITEKCHTNHPPTLATMYLFLKQFNRIISRKKQSKRKEEKKKTPKRSHPFTTLQKVIPA